MERLILQNAVFREVFGLVLNLQLRNNVIHEMLTNYFPFSFLYLCIRTIFSCFYWNFYNWLQALCPVTVVFNKKNQMEFFAWWQTQNFMWLITNDFLDCYFLFIVSVYYFSLTMFLLICCFYALESLYKALFLMKVN